MTTRKTLSKKTNSNGKVFALVSDGVTFEVWAQCENYASHCKGGISKQWRYIEKGLSEFDAKMLFDRRTK